MLKLTIFKKMLKSTKIGFLSGLRTNFWFLIVLRFYENLKSFTNFKIVYSINIGFSFTRCHIFTLRENIYAKNEGSFITKILFQKSTKMVLNPELYLQ